MRRVSHSPATRSVICRRRSRLAALAMLGLVAVSFAVNGRAPGGVNLRPKDLAEMTAPTGGRPVHGRISKAD
jgi:hypothetical protein